LERKTKNTATGEAVARKEEYEFEGSHTRPCLIQVKKGRKQWRQTSRKRRRDRPIRYLIPAREGAMAEL